MKSIQKKPSTETCPYQESILLLGNKWTLQIIKELHLQKRHLRFNELMKALTPVSSKTMALKLKELCECGVLRKEITNMTPVRIQYSLTEKGKELTQILDTMAQWNLKWREK